jgi:1-deoxy-D-xylulose-5-phosphate reductoisomerase
MTAGKHSEIHRIIITSSGGALRGVAAEDLAKVTAKQALNHPTWQMGPKVTIDSATLMNKALELIEAHWLFKVPVDRIELMIHPQSIVHSLVEFVDGSVIAQMGNPDMRSPIQYALTWPDRLESRVPRLSLTDIGTLHFDKPDARRFPAVALGYEAARKGGTAATALNAANEVAVQAFLDGRIRFPDITTIVATVMCEHRFLGQPTLEDILRTDSAARASADELVAAKRM